MKRSTKLITMVVAIMMIVAVFAGCTDKSTETPATEATEATEVKEPETIQWWSPNWDETVSRELVAEFEAANPDIKIDLVITDWDSYKAKTTAAISAKNAPELISVLLTDVKPFVQAGFLEPIDAHMVTVGYDSSDLLDSAKNIVSYEDNLYAMPFRYDGSGIYYNVDMLAQVGYDQFPTTYEELDKMHEDLKVEGITACAWPLGNQPNAIIRYAALLATEGGQMLSDDETTATLDTPEAVAAMERLANSILDGYASKNSLEYDNTKLRDAFGSEQFAYYVGGPYDVDPLEESYPDVTFKAAVMAGNGGMGYTTADGWCIILAEKSNNKEAAARFMAFVGLPENQARLTASFPASIEGLKQEKFSTEYMTPFADQLVNSVAAPAYTRYAEMQPIIYKYIQMAITGQVSSEEACQQMTKELNALLAS